MIACRTGIGAPKEHMKDFDLVLFGATGFTGRLVAEYIATAQKREGRRTGRSPAATSEKLEALGARACRSCIVDAMDPAACARVAKRTRVVCTTVGPYAKYGSALVAACAEAGTHYCDLTGEVNFMRASIDAHHERAKQTGARIVHACGFDSIPSDLGTWATQQEFTARFGRYGANGHRVLRRDERRHVGRHRRERLRDRRGDARSGGPPRAAQPVRARSRSGGPSTAPDRQARRRLGRATSRCSRAVLHGRDERAGRAPRPRARRVIRGARTSRIAR